MKSNTYKNVIFLLLALLSTNYSKAQLTTTGGLTPQQLVQNLLGPGIQVSNITLIGGPNSTGTFDGTLSNLGINTGIVLTSGDIINAAGANNSGSSTGTWQGAGDPTLDSVIAGITNDATVLEFDFIPATTIVTFRFVFGSEEYNEYVNSFNDVFGFFISGPGFVGQQNVALIPSTTIPVSIANVNNGNAFGQSTGPCTNCAYYFDNFAGTTVQYDGFTVPIMVQFNVNPCQTYHIKLAVADAQDFSFDSGVFIEAGSFTGGTPITVTSAVNNPVIDEGCGQSIITFTFDSVLSSSDTIWFGPGGTAQQSLDYGQLPFYVIANAGDSTVSVTVSSLPDNLIEGNEILNLYYVYYSNCGTVFDSVQIEITDIPPVDIVASNDTIVCAGTTLTLSATATGGLGSLTYTWDNTFIGQSYTVTPTQTTTYTLVVDDQCASADTILITVTISNQPLNVTTSNDTTVCPGSTLTLTANAVGAGTLNYVWDNTSTGQNYTVTPLQTTVYTVVVSDACGQTSSATVNVSIITTLPNIVTPNDTLICGGSTITLVASANGGTADYNFIWDNSVTGAAYTVSPTQNTSYTVVVSDACNLKDTGVVNVNLIVEPVLSFDFINEICLGDASVITYTGTNPAGSIINWDFANGTVKSGTGNGPYNVVWNNANVHEVLFSISYPGCYDKIDTLPITEKLCELIIPNIITPNGDGVNETFYVKGLENYDGSALLVYDRWGNVLLNSSNYQNDWYANGNPDGVYFYILTVPGKEIFKGTITVLREKK